MWRIWASRLGMEHYRDSVVVNRKVAHPTTSLKKERQEDGNRLGGDTYHNLHTNHTIHPSLHVDPEPPQHMLILNAVRRVDQGVLALPAQPGGPELRQEPLAKRPVRLDPVHVRHPGGGLVEVAELDPGARAEVDDGAVRGGYEAGEGGGGLVGCETLFWRRGEWVIDLVGVVERA